MRNTQMDTNPLACTPVLSVFQMCPSGQYSIRFATEPIIEGAQFPKELQIATLKVPLRQSYTNPINFSSSLKIDSVSNHAKCDGNKSARQPQASHFLSTQFRNCTGYWDRYQHNGAAVPKRYKKYM